MKTIKKKWTLLVFLCALSLCTAQTVKKVFKGEDQNVIKTNLLDHKVIKDLQSTMVKTDNSLRITGGNAIIELLPQKIQLKNAAPFISTFSVWEGKFLDPSMITIQYRSGSKKRVLSDWKSTTFDGHDEQTEERLVSKMVFLDKKDRFIQYRLLFSKEHPAIELFTLEYHHYSPGETPEDEMAYATSESKDNFKNRACDRPPVVSRNQWGAIFRNPAGGSTVSHLLVHHEFGSNSSSDWAARVRSIQRFHINGNGWSDIGYNFLVDPNGVIYEGRAGGDSAVGAHFCGFNRNTMAVCMLGDYSTIAPTALAQSSLKNVLAFKAAKDNINPTGSSFHYSGRTLPHISGHRDGGCSACPGDGMYTLLGEVRSDVGSLVNNGCGPGGGEEDTSIPTTSMTAVGGNNQNSDFQVNFDDDDNVGVTRTYYQVLERYGNDWLANRTKGFFNDNFNNFYTAYQVDAGNWNVANGRMTQTNTTETNTDLSAYLDQNSNLPYLYEFSARTISTSGPRKFGIHIMASSQTQSQRGDSYLVWFSGADNKVRIYETVNNVLNFRAIADVRLDNNWAKYRITYSPAFGVLQVFKNNDKVLQWSDSSPISSGSSISLRTNQTNIEVDDLKVYKYRLGDQVTVEVGNTTSNDLRTSSGKIKSMVRDEAGNWSLPGNLDVSITSRNSTLESAFTIEENNISIYPNAIEDEGFLKVTSDLTNKSFSYTIFDLTGSVLYQSPQRIINTILHTENLSESLDKLKQGTYIIKVTLNGKSYSESFLKK